MPFHQTSLYLRVSRYHIGLERIVSLRLFFSPLRPSDHLPQRINGQERHLTSTTHNDLHLKVHLLSSRHNLLLTDDLGQPDLNSSLITTIPKKPNNAGVIIAGVLVGILVIAIALVSYLIYRRRKSHKPQEFPRASPNLKVMRLSAARPITTSPYRTFFAPPSYSESTTHLNASVYRTETQSSIGTNHSRTTNSYVGHEIASTWGFNNPSLLIAMPQVAAQGWNEKKSHAVNHKKRQLRLVS